MKKLVNKVLNNGQNYEVETDDSCTKVTAVGGDLDGNVIFEEYFEKTDSEETKNNTHNRAIYATLNMEEGE